MIMLQPYEKLQTVGVHSFVRLRIFFRTASIQFSGRSSFISWSRVNGFAGLIPYLSEMKSSMSNLILLLLRESLKLSGDLLLLFW